jgi:hypothetical protein
MSGENSARRSQQAESLTDMLRTKLSNPAAEAGLDLRDGAHQ